MLARDIMICQTGLKPAKNAEENIFQTVFHLNTKSEKNSKYFLNLENRHCKRKTIVQIKGNNSSYLTNHSDILEECNSFYGSLYNSRTSATVNNYIRNWRICFLIRNSQNVMMMINKNAKDFSRQKNVWTRLN